MTNKTCIVGGGISGLTTAKAFLDKGIEFELFEKESSIGGVWFYREDPTKFSIYKSCHTIANKRFMAFSDLPISDDYKDYMSNRQYFAYVKEYVEKFKLADHVTLDTTVTEVSKVGDGTWYVTIETGGETETRTYANVVVATGLFHTPKYPDYFVGPSENQTHSAYYRTPDSYERKNVLVVGLGNSGADIACDLASRAAKVSLSSTSSAHVFVKYVLGRPFLEYTTPYDDYLPFRIQQLMARFLMWLGRGKVQDYGLPAPKHDILVKNPVVSSRLLDAIHCGDIDFRPGIRSLAGETVTFEDGTVQDFDNIIYATGYRVAFPFFDSGLIDFKIGAFCSYLHIVNLQHENLYFVGLVNPLGTLPPVVELQAKFVAQLLSGGITLPSRDKMERQVRRLDRKMRRRFQLDGSDEPTINIDFHRYQHRLRNHLAS